MISPKPHLALRDVEPADAARINRYWAETDEKDWLRLGELGRPSADDTSAFIQSLCANRPSPETAEEGILVWCLDGTPIGYVTLKAIRFQNSAQIHLHLWEKAMRGKGLGSVLFCLSALEFIARFRLKALYCQPKADNPMPNGMLRKIGFFELPPCDYRRKDDSVVEQSRYLIAPSVAERYLEMAKERFRFSSPLPSSLYLETSRLLLFRPKPRDLGYIGQLLGTRALTSHPGELPDGRQVSSVADGILAHWDRNPYGTCLIQLKSSGTYIGLGGIKELTIEGEKLPDLGLMFLSGYQGQRLGLESAEAAIHCGHSVHGLERIVANTTESNIAALQLLKRLGFRFVKKVSYESGGVQHRDSLLWELTRAKSR